MQLPYAELGAKTLSLTVYDFDRFSKHDHIGQVVIPLNSVDLGRVVEEWRVLVSPVHDEKVRRVNFTRSVENNSVVRPDNGITRCGTFINFQSEYIGSISYDLNAPSLC